MKPKVVINGTSVGSVSAVEVDQPWFSGLFEPLPAFATYGDLFTKLNHAYRDKRYEEVDRLDRDVSRLHVQIVEPDGRVSFATHRDVNATTPMTCVRFDVRFETGIMSWRPAPAFL